MPLLACSEPVADPERFDMPLGVARGGELAEPLTAVSPPYGGSNGVPKGSRGLPISEEP